MHDRVIRTDSRDLGLSGRLMIDVVVVMGSRSVVVILIDVIGRRVHMQRGRLHVHQRESGNESERDQSARGGNHRVPPIVLHSAESQSRAGPAAEPTAPVTPR